MGIKPENTENTVQIVAVSEGPWTPIEWTSDNKRYGAPTVEGDEVVFHNATEVSASHFEPKSWEQDQVVNASYTVGSVTGRERFVHGWRVYYWSAGGHEQSVFFPQRAVSWDHSGCVGSDGRIFRGQFFQAGDEYVVGLVRERRVGERGNGEPQVEVPDLAEVDEWLEQFKSSQLFVDSSG